MIKMNGTLSTIKESTRFNNARMRIIHFSFRKTPVSIRLKNMMLMINEKAVGIQRPKRLSTNAVREIAGKNFSQSKYLTNEKNSSR